MVSVASWLDMLLNVEPHPLKVTILYTLSLITIIATIQMAVAATPTTQCPVSSLASQLHSTRDGRKASYIGAGCEAILHSLHMRESEAFGPLPLLPLLPLTCPPEGTFATGTRTGDTPPARGGHGRPAACASGERTRRRPASRSPAQAARLPRGSTHSVSHAGTPSRPSCRLCSGLRP